MKLILMLFTLFIFQFMSSQESIIEGYVYDSKTNAPIEGATVIIQNTDFGTVTNVNGRFIFSDLSYGTYTIEVTHIGYHLNVIYNFIHKRKGNDPLEILLDESVFILNEIILDNKFSSSLHQSVVPEYLMNKIEIISYPGGNNDPLKAIQSLPGVLPSQGGFRNDFIIRGGGPSESVFYLDDMEIPVANHFSTQGSGGGSVGIFNVNFVNNISLSTGGFNASYDLSLIHI
ncbi:MAG: TonB-dependent receptor, partial [Flavobacteriia bacterium]|nr:TonB-dependent receptor [Flavobacteriia bacterium]